MELSEHSRCLADQRAAIVYDGQPTEQAQSSNGCGRGVFATISRFNHSCAVLPLQLEPAAGTDDRTRSRECGEELTISYLAEGGRIRAERQELLRRDFGFLCVPSMCTHRRRTRTQRHAPAASVTLVRIPTRQERR